MRITKLNIDIENGFPLKIHHIFILTLFLFSTINLRAQKVEAEANLDTNNILIGDQIYLNLKLTQEKNIFVQWPIIEDTLSKNIEVLEEGKLDTISTKDGNWLISKKYRITSFDSGYFVIRPLIFIYDFQNDTTYKQEETNALLLTVNTIAVDTTMAIKDIKGIEDEPYTFGEIFLNFVLPAVAVILIALLIIYIIRRKKAHKPIFGPIKKPLPPPDIEAIAALNQLREKKLWQQNAVKEYYSHLTDIMRRYIERRFDFPAQEMVTSEIIGSLEGEKLDQSILKATEEVLSIADLVKFAKYEPLGNVNDANLNWGYEFIKNTTPTEIQEEGKEDKS